MKIIADMHTHTVASGHAYSTVNEMAQEASRKGLQALALTDHGPALPGGPHLYHFGAMRFIPPWISGVRILRGVEANIIVDLDGSLDMPDSYLAKLDFAMAAFHEDCGFNDQGIDRNTDASPAGNEPIHGSRPLPIPATRPFRSIWKNSSRARCKPERHWRSTIPPLPMSRKGSRPRCEQLATLIARSGAMVVVGSDAHIAQGVGEFENAVDVLLKAGIRCEQVVNSSYKRLMAFLGLEEVPMKARN